MAEDIIGDTFVAVIEQLDRFDVSRGTERAWVYGIATNLLRHYLRQQRRRSAPRPRYLDNEVGLDIVADRVSDQVDAQRQVQQLAAALELMPDEARDVLLLTAWNGLTSAEIAQVLDIPAGTVRSRLHRVRQDLRAARPQLESDLPATQKDAKK